MRYAIVALLLAMVPLSVPAHHSAAMFDKNKVIEAQATVREFQWTNPHVWIEITITNEDGESEDWSIEGLGTNSLFRKGWRPTSFAYGQRIMIRFNPMRDGSAAGGFIGAMFEDGSTLGKWD